MSRSRTQNATRNIYTGIVGKIVSLILPFVSRTIILYYLGVNYLGIGTLLSSVLSFLSLAELGFSSAITFAMYKPVAEDNTEKLCSLLKYYKKLYRLIGLIILILGCSIVPILRFLIKGNIPQDINLYILYFIYLVNSVVSYFFAGYKQGLLNAYQRMDITNVINLCVSIINNLVQIVVLLLTKNYYCYAIVPVVGTIITNATNSIITSKLFPNIRPLGNLDSGEKKAIFNKLGGLFGSKLNSIVVHQADILVISSFIGITTVAIYGNYYYIMNAVAGFILIVFNSLTASVGNKIATDSIEECFKLYKRINVINAAIVNFCTTCFICLFQPFMKIWVGSSLMFDMIFVILFVLYFFVYEIQRTTLLFKDAAGLWREDRYRPYISMVFNVVSNLVLVRIIGIYGIVLSTVLAFCISLPWVNNVLFKYLFKRSPTEGIVDVVKYLIISTISAVTSWIICSQIPEGIVWLFVRLIICTGISSIVFILILSRTNDFKEGLLFVKSFIKRKVP